MDMENLRKDLEKLGSDMPDNEKKLLIERLANDLGDELPLNRMRILAEFRSEITVFLNNTKGNSSIMNYIRGVLDGMGMVCAAYMSRVRDDFYQKLIKKIEKILCQECRLIYAGQQASIWPRGLCDKCAPAVNEIYKEVEKNNFQLIISYLL